MQLHKRKRCYVTRQESIPHRPSNPLMHQQQTPPVMSPHFYGVTIKQEPMPLSSSCPLSSPKQIKRSSGGCMDDMVCCSAPQTNMCGTQCMETAPPTGSPSTMSAFLSPHCSPKDSSIGKPAKSPQPLSPNCQYLLSSPMRRDGCPHPHSQDTNRAHTMLQV